MIENAKILHRVVEKAIRVLKLDIKLSDTIVEDSILINDPNIRIPIDYDVYVSYSNSEKWCSIYSNNINVWEYFKTLIKLEDIISPNRKIGLTLYLGDTLDEYYSHNGVSNMHNLLEMSDEELELLLRLN